MQTLEYASFWKRLAASLIDTSLIALFYPMRAHLLDWCFTNRNFTPYIVESLVWVLIFLVMVVRLGATPGKLILSLRIVDKESRFLIWPAALKRISPYLVISVIIWLSFYYMFLTLSSLSEQPITLEVFNYMSVRILVFGNFSQKWHLYLSLLLSFFVVADFSVILFSEKKRAIRDYLAGSYVVTKASYLDGQN